MAILGPNDLKQFALPPGYDAALLSNLRLADGTTYEQMLNDVTTALSIANGQLFSDPLYASLVGPGNGNLTVEYPVGVTNGFEDHTEYSRPDARRAITSGHMFEPVDKDRQLGWTRDSLEKMRMTQIEVNVASAIQDLKALFEKSLLQRLFKSTYTAVGSAGKSMPVADGGTADSTFIPWNNPNRATAFAYTHSHLNPYNGIVQAAVDAAVLDLWEHGYDAPYDILVAQADLSSWQNTTNVTGFVKRAEGLIRYGDQTDLATVDTSYIGVIESAYGPVRMRATARIPTTYYVVYKSFGPFDSRNVLRVDADGRYPIGAYLEPGPENMPLVKAFLRARFWQGIGDRTAAALGLNTAGGWSDPTIV